VFRYSFDKCGCKDKTIIIIEDIIIEYNNKIIKFDEVRKCLNIDKSTLYKLLINGEIPSLIRNKRGKISKQK
ncbi:MAG: hypothetical protein K2K89_00930, partial [Ruminococcus sp.]|nr:hypothetical protein [Ruminococcus sp.]